MATLGVGPVPRMNPGGGRYSSTKPHRRKVEAPKTPIATPSYEVEEGAPIGAKKWLKSLFQANAIHLSAERIASLVGRARKEEAARAAKEIERPKDTCGPTCVIYREAVALEQRDAALHAEKTTGSHRGPHLIPLLLLGTATVFLLTVAVLDAVFGTRSLSTLLSLILR